jgi:hypothetical protein
MCFARLDGALWLVGRETADGKLGAGPRSVQVIEQVDRYHGRRLHEEPDRCIDRRRAISAPLTME